MRAIPDNNLAYPVFIQLYKNTDKSAAGSGFLLNTGDKLFLITAKHVLYSKENKLISEIAEIDCQTDDIKDDSITKMSINLNTVKILKHATADVAAIQLGKVKENSEKTHWDIDYLPGITQKLKAKSNIVAARAKTATKRIKDILISNDVFLYGYPISLGLKESPQFDYSKPLLRKGIIANIYELESTIILDCPSFPGNSGGPVVEIEQKNMEFHHKVIGVVSQFIPFVQNWVNQSNGLVNTELINSGYSVAVSMDKVFETIGFDPDK